MIVPSEPLSRLEPSDVETTIGFAIGVYSEAATTAGDCQVTLTVSGSATTPEGDPAGGVVNVL